MVPHICGDDGVIKKYGSSHSQHTDPSILLVDVRHSCDDDDVDEPPQLEHP